MKPSFIDHRRLLLALFCFCIVSFAHAGPGAEDVSTKVLTSFANNFNAAKNVSWKVTKQFSKASFIINNRQTEVFYNPRNKLIATSECITLSELPNGGAQSITREYGEYTPVSAIRYIDVEGKTIHFVQLENNKNKLVVQVNNEGELDCIKTERK